MYSQSGTFYDILPNAPQPGSSKAPTTPSIDDIIGSMSHTSRNSSPSNPGKQNYNPSNDTASQPTSNSCKTTEVNVVQANTLDKTSKGKNKGKGKAKVNTLKQDSQKSHTDDGS